MEGIDEDKRHPTGKKGTIHHQNNFRCTNFKFMIQEIVGVWKKRTKFFTPLLNPDYAVAPRIDVTCVCARNAHYFNVYKEHDSGRNVEHHYIRDPVKELIVRSACDLLLKKYSVETRRRRVEVYHNAPKGGVDPYRHNKGFTPSGRENVSVIIRAYNGDVTIDTDNE